MISQDVFRSFSIPAFRVKCEVILGRYSTVWFEATQTGICHLFSTEYCGINHSAMIGDIVAMTPDDYQAGITGSTSGSSLGQNGERLFANLGCNSCQSGEASARGPNLANVYGSRLQLTGGSHITADDWRIPSLSSERRAFLREAFLNPSTRATAGYAPILPTNQGQVSERGLIDLVEYGKNLNSNYRIQQTLTARELPPTGSSSSGPSSSTTDTGPAERLGKAAP
jgi:cytochrome c oxidase subunit 2